MLNSREQRTDWMTCSSKSKILRRHMQINLRTSDLSMTEQIATCHESNAGAYQVSCKRVAAMSPET
jgi:hypothetical protein